MGILDYIDKQIEAVTSSTNFEVQKGEEAFKATKGRIIRKAEDSGVFAEGDTFMVEVKNFRNTPLYKDGDPKPYCIAVVKGKDDEERGQRIFLSTFFKAVKKLGTHEYVCAKVEGVDFSECVEDPEAWELLFGKPILVTKVTWVKTKKRGYNGRPDYETETQVCEFKVG